MKGGIRAGPARLGLGSIALFFLFLTSLYEQGTMGARDAVPAFRSGTSADPPFAGGGVGGGVWAELSFDAFGRRRLDSVGGMPRV